MREQQNNLDLRVEQLQSEIEQSNRKMLNDEDKVKKDLAEIPQIKTLIEQKKKNHNKLKMEIARHDQERHKANQDLDALSTKVGKLEKQIVEIKTSLE